MGGEAVGVLDRRYRPAATLLAVGIAAGVAIFSGAGAVFGGLDRRIDERLAATVAAKVSEVDANVAHCRDEMRGLSERTKAVEAQYQDLRLMLVEIRADVRVIRSSARPVRER